jgi:hypothetical protein
VRSRLRVKAVDDGVTGVGAWEAGVLMLDTAPPISRSRPPARGAAARPTRRVLLVAASIGALALGLGAGAALYLAAAAAPAHGAGRAVAHATSVLGLERHLGIDIERAVQASPVGHGALGLLMALVYTGLYWPFVVGAVIVTARRDVVGFRLLRNAVLISGGIGLVTMALYPVAPPRLLAGYVGGAGHPTLAAIAHPSGWFNPNAAMPSFHVCWMLLAACGLRRAAPRAVRWVPPALMTVAVVATGNHYVLDVVAGTLLAVAAWRLATPMQVALDDASARSARRRRRSAVSASSEL